MASLPLLGYAVFRPSDEDGIHKDFVFKLQFKNHVYFFRAERQYTFERFVKSLKRYHILNVRDNFDNLYSKHLDFLEKKL